MIGEAHGRLGEVWSLTRLHSLVARLWADLTRAIKAADMDAATDAKAKVEDGQREMARRREASGQTHQTRFFQPVGDKWMPKLNLEQ